MDSSSSSRKYLYLAAAVVLLLWVGAGIYYWQSKGGAGKGQGPGAPSVAREATRKAGGEAAEGEEQAPQTPPRSFSGWSAHQNEEFGYQIDYPQEMKPRDQGAVGTKVLNLTNFVPSEDSALSVVGVRIVSTPYADLEERMRGLSGAGYTVQEATLGGKNGLRVSGKRSGTEEMVYEALAPIAGGEQTVRIITSTEGENEEHLKVFDRMVKSFSFL